MTVYVHTEDLEARLADLRALPDGTPCGFDFEYTAPPVEDDMDITQLTVVGVSVHCAAFGLYVPMAHRGEANARPAAVQAFLQGLVREAPRLRVWAWSLGAELGCLDTLGVDYGGTSDQFYDGLVACWLNGEGTTHDLGLKKYANRTGDTTFPSFKELARGRTADVIPVAELSPYCIRDSELCWQLGERAYAQLVTKELTDHFHQIDMPCVAILNRMNRVGFAVDAAALETAQVRLRTEADELAARFLELTTTALLCPFTVKQEVGTFKNGKPKTKAAEISLWDIRGAHPGKDREVAHWCYEVLKVWPTAGLKRTGTGLFPTDRETLEQFIPLGGLAAELVQCRFDFQTRNKLLSTYVGPMAAKSRLYSDGRLHPTQHLCGTETQRFSCSGPNLQNLPSRSKEGKAVRAAFVARPGRKLVVVDMNQAELRIAAHLSKDEELGLCYHLEEDVHLGTLERLQQHWPEAARTDAKITNFSSLYSITAPTLAVKMKSTEARAEIAIAAFYGRFRSLLPFHESCYAYVTKHGYMRTIDGFRRPLDNVLVTDWKTRQKGLSWTVKNQCANTAVQGSVAGLAKLVLVAVSRKWRASGWLGSKVELVMTEHDSLVAEADDDVAEVVGRDIQQAMETTWSLRVPFKADIKIGRTWADCK